MTSEAPGGPSIVEHLYTEELLRGAFVDWGLLRAAAYERELDEGEGHKGMSAVIDLVARCPEAVATVARARNASSLARKPS